MGLIWKLGCECSYEEKVDEGRGFRATIRTFTCLDCQRIVGVTVARAETRGLPQLPVERRCPHCAGANLRPWSADSPSCPRCGMRLEVEQAGLWD